MKKKLAIIISLILTIACVTGIAVYATETQTPPIERVTVYQDKNYYAYYNDASCVGAVAFCLNNKFTDYGTTTENLMLCTKNTDGTHTALYTVEKANVTTQFAGNQEYKLLPGDELSALLGGLGGIGISLERDKTNLAFSLNGQPIKKGTEYYVYIPADYYIDASGKGNAPAYLKINASTVNSYTGDLLKDLKNATSGLYDTVLFAAESINGILS